MHMKESEILMLALVCYTIIWGTLLGYHGLDLYPQYICLLVSAVR